MKGKLNKISNIFSIKDLEELTGIKSHTIRIWESRYNLLQPDRTETNLRSYNMDQLQKLLNVSLLNKNGYKISKIAQFSPADIKIKVLTLSSQEAMYEKHIDDLKIATLNFDVLQFNEIYDSLLKKNSFHEVFMHVFIPFLEYVGLLWQSNAIAPSHEHFVSNLVRQKILHNIEKESGESFKPGLLFVPFLPMNEIHELGMLYVHYYILSLGYESIYLGQSVPIKDLELFTNRMEKVIYVSSFTVYPTEGEALDYINEVAERTKVKEKDELWLSGNRTKHLTSGELPVNCYLFDSFMDMFVKMQNLGKKIEAH